jgi:hypothetical protein
MSEGTDTLTIRLEDDATDAANAAATALERLAKSQDTQAKAGIGGVDGEKQSTAFKRLREMGTQAGSALSAAFAGVQNRMINAVTATTSLSSALQLATNRARELRAAEARDMSAAMGQANRTPTALQSSPQAIDWAKALATVSAEAGSALRAQANDALESAAAMAFAAANGAKLSSVYDLVAKRVAAASAAERASTSEQVNRANRMPTALQSSPQAIDWAAALAKVSKEAGSAQRAAAEGALEFATAAAMAAVDGAKLSSVYDLVAKRAAQAKNSDARQLSEDMARANRTPTALQSSPKEIDWAGALAEASNKSGSALKAAATNALELATAEATAVTNAQKLATVYDLVAKRAAAAAKSEAKVHSEQETRANQLPTALKQAGPSAPSGFQKLVGGIESLFGPKAAGTFVEGARGLADVSDKLGPIGPMLVKAGIGLGAGAAVGAALLVAAAVKVASIMYDALKGVLLASIDATDRRTKAVAGFGKGGKDVYNEVVGLSVDLSLDLDETLKEAKGLVITGFKKEQIPVIIEAVADIRIAKGDEAAAALQKQLEKTKAKGIFNTESVNGLAEAGIRADLIYAALAKSTGASIAIVTAKVKAGQISVEKGIDAILAAAKEQGGGAAGEAADTVSGIITSLKIQASTMFDDVNTGPLKEAGFTLSKILAGPEGDKLKTAATGLANQLFKTLFGPFQGPDGQKRLELFITRITEVATTTTSALKDLAPYVESFVDIILAFTGADMSASDNGAAQLITAIADAARLAVHPLQTIERLVKSIWALGAGAGAAVGLDASNGGQTAGDNLARGFKVGILSGTAGAVSAAIDMAKAALAGVASPAGQDSHSPSKKAAKLGGHFTSGYAIQIAAGGADVKQAGAALAMKAIGGTAAQQGANDVGPLAAPGGGPGAGGGVTFNIEVNGTGTPEQNKKAGQEIGAAAYAEWSMHFGHKMRDMKRAAG